MLAASARTRRMTHERNVAIAWAKWLLREDDSPQSFLDAAMNGLAAGVLLGGGADILHLALRKPRTNKVAHDYFLFTRRGATFGCAVSLILYSAQKSLSRSRALESSHTTLKAPDVLGDPWGASASPHRSQADPHKE